MLLAGLSTGHKIGLAVVGFSFIAFALASSFLAPRRDPDFPGRKYMSVYVIACLALFGAMIASVLVFGRESEAKGAEAAVAAQGSSTGKTIVVKESEYVIQLPPLKTLSPGKYELDVENVGTVAHNLAITGPKLTGPSVTPTIKPSGSAKLTVSLEKGTYTLFCAIPGHRALGMVAKVSVG